MAATFTSEKNMVLVKFQNSAHNLIPQINIHATYEQEVTSVFVC